MYNDTIVITVTDGTGYKRKPPIPKGAEVEINYYHINFYGAYFNVKYNNKSYDIATRYIKLVKA